jgi:glycosyltransferase involved in cell wall biosynthesis
MKIAYLTAGAAGMYCGSCMRDNTLAAALTELGEECLLLPTYTPPRTDEPDVSTPRIFFGGISVYLEQKYRWLRNMPGWLDRLLSGRWLLRQASKFAIDTRAEELAALTISMLKGNEGFQRRQIERLLDWLQRSFRPDLVCLTNLLLSGVVPAVRQQLGVPVVGTLQGDDIFLESLPPGARAEAIGLIGRNCGEVAAFITPCRAYADSMASYLSLPRERFRVVYPGLNLKGYPAAPPAEKPAGQPPRIGYLARIAPEKGLANLIDAAALLARRADVPRFEVHAAGYLGARQRGYLEEQKAKAAAGPGQRFQYAGEPDHAGKIAFLSSLDVFCVPTNYVEPKGLYVLEALACGVPVVQPRHGSFPELLEATGGGVLVEPGRPQAVADALAELLLDPERRRALGAQGQRSVRARFTARRMAEDTRAVFAECLAS